MAANGSSKVANVHLRVARPTDDLDALLPFYREGLGFEVLGKFTDHDGFSGIMLGDKSAGFHLEFTTKTSHHAGKAPTQDNLLVFYLPDADQFHTAIASMKAAGFHPVPSFNPYWDVQGKTFEDPDGYRIVLQNAPNPMQ